MEPTAFDVDEMIEFWTLLDEDRALLAGKRGATALGFAVLLKHDSRHGQFPRGRSEVPDDVIVFVAGQLGVDAADLSGSTSGRAARSSITAPRSGTISATASRPSRIRRGCRSGCRRLLHTRSVGLTVSVRSCWPSESVGDGPPSQPDCPPRDSLRQTLNFRLQQDGCGTAGHFRAAPRDPGTLFHTSM